MRALVLAPIILALAGCGVHPCKRNSVLLSLSYSGGAEAATSIDLTLTVDGNAAQTRTVAHAPAVTHSSVELDFAPYPAGQTLTVTVTARTAAATVATATQTFVAAPSCTSLEIALYPAANGDDMGIAAGADLSVTPAGDLATADLAAADLAAAPADMTVVPLCQTVIVSTLAGNGTSGFADGSGGRNGTAELGSLTGLGVDSAGNVYVADSSNRRIRKIDPSGNTTTLAGNGQAATIDGSGGPDGGASFNNPAGLVVDSAGNVYVTDVSSSTIRQVAPSGATTTLAGSGKSGFLDGPAASALFSEPSAIGVDSAGRLYIADPGNSRIRALVAGTTSTLAGNGTSGFVDGATGAVTEVDSPFGLSADTSYVYIADSFNSRVRKIAVATGATTTLAGSGNATLNDSDGTGAAADISFPTAVAVDGSGNLYVVSTAGGGRVRKITPDGTTTTVAGNNVAGDTDGVGCSAQFSSLWGIAVRGNTLWVADRGNHSIRKIQLP